MFLLSYQQLPGRKPVHRSGASRTAAPANSLGPQGGNLRLGLVHQQRHAALGLAGLQRARLECPQRTLPAVHQRAAAVELI